MGSSIIGNVSLHCMLETGALVKLEAKWKKKFDRVKNPLLQCYFCCIRIL
jgi:hypothetical protein